MSDALSFAEIDAQQVELLPARTVLSAFHGWYHCDYGHYIDYDHYADYGDDGGDGGEGGDNNEGGDGKGGDANADAMVKDNVNHGYSQVNIAVAVGGVAGDGHGGDVDADGGMGGDGSTHKM
jgi:hypothetical protein